MDTFWLSVLRCPLHPNEGHLKTQASDQRHDAELSPYRGLVCQRCGHVYPIVQGIPDLLAGSTSQETVRGKEMAQWDEHAPRYDDQRQRGPEYMAGVEAAVSAGQLQKGELILDAACGTGLTVRSYYQPNLRVVALDLSLASLQILQKRLAPGAIGFVRGDLSSLPFASGVFDKVLCANAIQHLPDERSRQACLGELARVARPGARVVVTAHNFSISRQRAGWCKEGAAGSYSGPVQFIHRFDLPEFRALLASALQVETVHGASFPLPYRWKLSRLSRGLELLLRRFRASAPWGNMLVGIGHKGEPGIPVPVPSP
jgi:ubiquinone/menaquinone biosynthesis C-methylase UbiE